MSSASAAIPSGSGAPNDRRARGRAASVNATGRPLATTAASHPSATSRWLSEGASAERRTTRRQRWRGSDRGRSGGPSTSGSLRHVDEPARNDPSPRGEPHDPTSEPAAARPPVADCGRSRTGPRRRSRGSALVRGPPAGSVRRDRRGGTAAPGAPVAARCRAHRRRGGRGACAVDGPRRGSTVHRRPAGRVPARSTGALADPRARPAALRDPDRLRRRDRRDRGVPQPDASPAGQRGDPVHRGLPCPHGAVRRTARAPRRVLRGTRHPARPARIHRRGGRGAHDRRIELQPRGPAAARDRRDDLHRRDLCLLPDPGVGLLHPQGPRAVARRRSIARFPPPGGPTPGRRSGSSSGCSANGSAGSCCSG